MGFVPEGATQSWKGAVRDCLMPGQIAARGLVEWTQQAVLVSSSGSGASAEARDLQGRLMRSEGERRRLEVECAVREQQWQRAGGEKGSTLHGEARDPLFVPQLVEARVLGEEVATLWRSGRLLGAGRREGIVESSLVLDDARPMIDQGNAARLSPGDAVYAGRCVLGKIAAVGRYTSTLVVITDPGYAGRARVARRTSQGLKFGSEGTLAGNGTALCRLRHVNEPVNVGDEVYTGGTDGVLPFPMFYGRIVRAEFEPAATEWTIDVEPATALDRFDRVQILRIAIDPGRILAD